MAQATMEREQKRRLGRPPTSSSHFFGAREGRRQRRDEGPAGGKGANLAEMTAIGIPVPPGFTISTAPAISTSSAGGRCPAGLDAPGGRGAGAPRDAAGKRFGDDATRCWCRCARAPSSRCRDDGHHPQPGPRTIEAVDGLARAGGRRALRLGLLPPLHPDVRGRRARHATSTPSRTLARGRKKRGVKHDTGPHRRRTSEKLAARYKAKRQQGHAASAFPQDP